MLVSQIPWVNDTNQVKNEKRNVILKDTSNEYFPPKKLAKPFTKEVFNKWGWKHFNYIYAKHEHYFLHFTLLQQNFTCNLKFKQKVGQTQKIRNENYNDYPFKAHRNIFLVGNEFFDAMENTITGSCCTYGTRVLKYCTCY